MAAGVARRYKRCTNRLRGSTPDPTHLSTAISKLKNSVSNTPDGVPSLFVKKTCQSLSTPLIKLFNLSLKLGKLPCKWKQAIVTPIHKKGPKSIAANYRPISLTSVVCRVLESIIHEYLVSYLSKNNLLSSVQHGFLKNRSTLTQHLNFLNEITMNCENSVASSVVFLDFSKAFDSVCHSKLLHVLNKIEINGCILNWIRNYLSNRSQQTIVEGILSKPTHVISGVPQGSVLGPLLFIIYVESLLKSLVSFNGISVYAFADDLKLVGNDNTKIQLALDFVSEWSQNWQLKVQPLKSEHLTFTRPGSNSCMADFNIDGSIIPKTNRVKDLGIILCNDFKWKPYISSIYGKSVHLVYVILKSFKSRNPKFYVNQYKTFIRPLLEYNVSVWMPTLRCDVKKVEQVQAKFTRLLCRKLNIKYKSYKERLLLLNLESLEARRIKTDLTIIYKIVHNLVDLEFDNYFEFYQSNYNLRRHSLTLKNQIPPKSFARKNFFSIRNVSIWNSLPATIVESKSLTAFKNRLKKLDLSCIYSSSV